MEGGININIVDLFCGCGGMSLGFQEAGFNILAGFEHWNTAISCYKKNFSHPVEDVDLSDRNDYCFEGLKKETNSITCNTFKATISTQICYHWRKE